MVPSIMASGIGVEATKHPYTITQPRLCLTAGVMFLVRNTIFALCDPCHRKSSTFHSSVHRTLFQTLGDHPGAFLQVSDKH
uniref:Uncharacterized protein n=1 Tax=Anguilla anguilla TaxID=7936 RepID=A0A0E9XHN2_ANGAN